MTVTTSSRQGEKGFTLVELSIVMIIIGLLIGGILKGQELIANARLAATVSKTKAIDAALNTFRDSYAALPGDVTTPNTRLPNCATSTKCGTAGNANNLIGVPTSASGGGTGGAQTNGSENIVAWAQLAATDLLGGIRNGQSADSIESGATIPSAEVPGQLFIGYENGTYAPVGALATGASGGAPIPRAGHYLLIHNGAAGAVTTSTGAGATTTASLTPSQAFRIDTKLDDGTPNNGAVFAMGAGSATGCASANTIAATYNTAVTGTVCGVYIRVQQ